MAIGAGRSGSGWPGSRPGRQRAPRSCAWHAQRPTHLHHGDPLDAPQPMSIKASPLGVCRLGATSMGSPTFGCHPGYRGDTRGGGRSTIRRSGTVSTHIRATWRCIPALRSGSLGEVPGGSPRDPHNVTEQAVLSWVQALLEQHVGMSKSEAFKAGRGCSHVHGEFSLAEAVAAAVIAQRRLSFLGNESGGRSKAGREGARARQELLCGRSGEAEVMIGEAPNAWDSNWPRQKLAWAAVLDHPYECCWGTQHEWPEPPAGRAAGWRRNAHHDRGGYSPANAGLRATMVGSQGPRACGSEPS